MKKMRKGKKMLLILLIAIVAVVIVTFVVKIIKDNIQELPSAPEDMTIIKLPETTYSDMEVRNIVMEYRKNSDETIITMDIYNTTKQKVEKQHFDLVLIGQEDEILGQKTTYIQSLEVNEQHNVTVVYSGDLTSTKQIKLLEK